MSNAFVALGTNIEPREDHLRQAIQSLEDHIEISLIEKSPVYETEPVGYTDQADFLNMVVHIETDLTPDALLKACQDIEQQLGRKRTIRFGPRSIDLDVLLVNNITLNTEKLTIPHPRMHERAFVLIPLQKIAPNIEVSDQSVKELINQLPDEDLEGVRFYKDL